MQTSSSHPALGDVWMVNLGPPGGPGGPIGHEQGGRRPALVVSANALNTSAASLVVVVPLTTRFRDIPTHVAITPPDGNLATVSYVLCEQVRAISVQRLGRYVGTISPAVLERVQHVVRLLLAL
jgi:mRNA interferase MazF